MAALDPARPEDPTMDAFRQDGAYLGADHRRNERRTWIVTVICSVSLVAQITGGFLFRSLALTASGLHMAAHVAALLAAAAAYSFSRKHAGDPRFAFGTGKLGYLAGFANGVVLATTAVFIAAESLKRLVAPEHVDYAPAIPLAAASLIVTLICVALLKPDARTPAPDGDLNLAAAHIHLTADAVVSVLAILGLFAGQVLGWGFADPLAGLVGAILVGHFALSLLRRAGGALLDITPGAELTAEIRARLSAGGETVVDLHVWRLGPGHNAAIAVISSEHPQPVEAYHARLNGLKGLSHLTIEVRGGGQHHHGHTH